MAKLSGPLMSMSASGTIGKSITYGTWKGIKYARQRVVPANPNSAAQQTQRSYLTDAVAAWRSTTKPLNALDKTNLDRGALYSGIPQSGSNLFVSQRVETEIDGGELINLRATVETTVAATSITIDCTHDVSNATRMMIGTSPSAMLTAVNRTQSSTPGTASTFTKTGLSASTKYYYRIEGTGENNSETLGIGMVTTAAS